MKGLSINPDQDIRGIRKEYESLKWRARKKIDTFDSLMWVVHPILTAVAILIVAVKTRDIGWTIAAGALYVYIPGAIVSLTVSAILDAFVGKRFGLYLENRRLTRHWYRRYILLDRYIAEHDDAERLRLEEKRRQEAEAKRLRLLPLQNAIKEIREQVDAWGEIVSDIYAHLQRKRKWYGEYREHEESIEQCLDELIDLESAGQDLGVKFEDLSKESPFLLYSLFEPITRLQNRCESLLGKMQAMKDWTPPIRTTPRYSTGRSAGNSRPHIEMPRTSRPTVAQFEDSNDDYDFSRPKTIQQPIVVAPPPPPKRRVLNKQLKKIPFEDYVGAAKLKMETGELGEIIVLHYEILRVDEETGHSGTGQVRRVSEESDSLGYDIESFSQGKNVFIEVKSTTSTFWTDFFLSANERKVMKELGERYWLYRIFELSKDDGSAKLSVFRGKSEIDASFELEATNYKINPKTVNSANGTLPFETLE